MNDKSMYKYWGKTKKNDDDSYDYHLLVYHCLDVAAVGKVWLDENKYFGEMASAASGLNKETFISWFIFFMAAHDIGKFKLSFQNLCPEILLKLQGISNPKIEYTVKHDQLGFELYTEWFFDHFFDIYFKDSKKMRLKDYIDIFANTSFGHHGLPPKSDTRVTSKKQNEILGYIEEIGRIFLKKKDFKELVTITNFEKDKWNKIKNSFKNFSWQMAGLITLCDWIASGAKQFFYCSDIIDLKDYFDETCKKAHQAIKDAEINNTLIHHKQGIERLFPNFKNSPTPLQKFCNDVSVSDQAQLWILEDVTGAGKTEAAIILASRIIEKGGGHGCFIALPTMATSNAMYERMAEIYSRLYEDGSRPSLVLSHGSRHLSDKFQQSYRDTLNSIPHNGEIYNRDSDEGSAHCSQWLADSSKKALLADVGVGTVDQVLLAGLPVRYQSLRSLGMSQKVLIIDEVHSFDAYMISLLENIIAIQASFGRSVILLSASLSFAMRERFCKAFYAALQLDYTPIRKKDCFPLITSVINNNLDEVSIETRKSVARTVKVEFCKSIDDVYSLIEKFTALGRCICWIRNTVADVMDSYEALENKNALTIDVFHSRFTLKDRLDIEKRVIKRFGKSSTPDERRSQVLVASQVVEQSLDLDFDVMISDLAPIDLLIQRAGRLHRHERKNRGQPIFYVYTPKDTVTPKSDWYSETFPKAKWVYKDTGILWRTKEILKKQKCIKMPEQARLLIESVYGSHEETEHTPEVFLKSESEALGKNMADTSIATFNRLNPNKGYCRLSSQRWDEEERIPTRLAEEKSIKVYLCNFKNDEIVPFHNDNIFPWDMSSISIRSSSITSVNYSEAIQNNILQLQKQRRFKNDSIFVVFSDNVLHLSGKNKNDAKISIKYDSQKGLLIKKEDE